MQLKFISVTVEDQEALFEDTCGNLINLVQPLIQ